MPQYINRFSIYNEIPVLRCHDLEEVTVWPKQLWLPANVLQLVCHDALDVVDETLNEWDESTTNSKSEPTAGAVPTILLAVMVKLQQEDPSIARLICYFTRGK